MSLTLLMALQAAAPATAQRVLSIGFDLADVRAAEEEGALPYQRRDCRRGAGDEIVVCGRRPSDEAFPMDEMARRYAEEPIVAEMGLGGGATARTLVEQVQLDRGAMSNRVMIRITIPF